MHRSHNALAVSRLAVLGVAILLFAAGCGGGGGGQSGDKHGTDTPASISHIDQILGIQGTLYADPLGYVTVKSRDSVGLFLHSDKIDERLEARNSFQHLNNLLKKLQDRSAEGVEGTED